MNTTVGANTSSYWAPDRSEPVLESTVGDALRAAADDAPDGCALTVGVAERSRRRRWSFEQLLADSETVAYALLGRFEPGERVAVWAPNVPEWVLLQYGAALAGLTLVTVNPAYRPSELEYVLAQSRAAGLFLVPEYRGSPMAAFLEQVRGDLPELREVVPFTQWDKFLATGSLTERLPVVSPDEPAQIQYTSGTTGPPKGALLHHRGITNSARFVAQRLEVQPGERWLSFMPLFHVAGCTITGLGALQARAAQVLCNFEPGLALELIETERCSLFVAGTTMYLMLMEHPTLATRDLSSLRTTAVGGMTTPAEVARRIESRLGVRFVIMFGLTEACGIALQTPLDSPAEVRFETIGLPLPQTEVKIAHLVTAEPQPLGTTGEICVRGYQVMSGYFEMPEATAAAIDPEGWLHTGDLGSMDSGGCCRIEGRVNELINRGAEKISPREIEDLLASHPTVSAAAVVGIPDEKWGEVVAAFVRPAPASSPTQQELFDYCRTRLAPHKTPKHWVFVDEFPLTPSGKVQKFVLRERFVAQTRR